MRALSTGELLRKAFGTAPTPCRLRPYRAREARPGSENDSVVRQICNLAQERSQRRFETSTLVPKLSEVVCLAESHVVKSQQGFLALFRSLLAMKDRP